MHKSGKTVLITGANTGLGLESAKRLLAAGASVIVTARSQGKVRTDVFQMFGFTMYSISEG